MELAGTIHVTDDDRGYEPACGMAFSMAGLEHSGLFRVEKLAQERYWNARLVGTGKLKKEHGITADILIDDQYWHFDSTIRSLSEKQIRKLAAKLTKELNGGATKRARKRLKAK